MASVERPAPVHGMSAARHLATLSEGRRPSDVSASVRDSLAMLCTGLDSASSESDNDNDESSDLDPLGDPPTVARKARWRQSTTPWRPPMPLLLTLHASVRVKSIRSALISSPVGVVVPNGIVIVAP